MKTNIFKENLRACLTSLVCLFAVNFYGQPYSGSLGTQLISSKTNTVALADTVESGPTYWDKYLRLTKNLTGSDAGLVYPIVMDEPSSLQLALVGGKDNLEGKTWYIGPWTAMRDPNNRENVWWNYGGPDPSMMNDEMIFTPNNVNPNGGYKYINNGDTYSNESAAGSFPDGNPAGSFVTTQYTPPSDATWDITQQNGKTILTLHKGFISYVTAPGDLQESQYEVLSYSPSSIKLVRVSGNPIWCFELVSSVQEDPLTGTGSKTWVVDGYNKHIADAVATAAPGVSIKGFMGLGPLNGYNQSWWAAGPGDKSYDNTLAAVGKGWTLYDWKITFTSSGQLKIVTAGEGYGRKAFDGQGFTSNTIQGDDMIFDYAGGSYTYTFNKGATPYPKLTLSGNAFMGYYAGTQEYEVVALTDNVLAVVMHDTKEGQDWIFVYTPASYLTVSPETYNFVASGGTSSTITITSNQSWTVSSNESWCIASSTSGSGDGQIWLEIAANTSSSPRSATVTVTGGGITQTISVTQDGATPTPTLTVSPTSYNFGASGGTSPTITVTSNQSWTVSSNASWLTTSRTSGSNNNTFTMTATANTSTSLRNAIVTISGGGITKTISVTQDKTVIYVMKNGVVVFQSSVLDIDNVTLSGAASGDVLVVNKNDGSPVDKIPLTDIQQLSFSDENLFVKTSIGSEMYAFNNIAKLLLGDIIKTNINNPSAQNGFDVLVYVTPTGDATVESPAAIKSLTLFSVDGKMIFKQHYNGTETKCMVSLRNRATGVYLLRVETEQGTVVKKVVKLLNK